jgi:hypothetical protein
MPRRIPDAETVAIDFRLSCKGLTAKELSGIYKDLNRMENCQPAFRNPAPPDYAVRAVHDIIVQISWPAVTAYIGKKVIDTIADILATVVKHRLTTGKQERKKTVTIQSPNGSARRVETQPKRPRARH